MLGQYCDLPNVLDTKRTFYDSMLQEEDIVFYCVIHARIL